MAGAGTCLLCDDWPGIDDCFQPGTEILVVKTAEDVVRALADHNDASRRQIGAAFHARGLRDHTYAQRAAQAEAAFAQCLRERALA